MKRLFLALLLPLLLISSLYAADPLAVAAGPKGPVPILDYRPDRMADIVGGTASTFVRASTAVRTDGYTMPVNWPAITSGVNLLEGAATNYYCQPYSTVGGAIVTDAPTTRTVTLPSTGDYCLWIKGNASLSVTIAAGTATGSGWGTITGAGYLKITLTASGTVVVTVSGGATGDKVQLTTGIVPTSFIPTPTTSPVTRASAGADTSGNGLSIPLSRAMRDSLTGELSDWTAAWSHVSGTAPTYSGGNKILTYSTQTSTDYHALLSAGVSVGDEIEVGYSISGLTGGVFQLGFGSGSTGEARSANGAYTERGTLTTDARLYALADTLTGTVTINYCRRVLDSGITNPGEGTVLCGVYLPWDSSVVPNSTSIGVLAATNAAFGVQTIYRSSGGVLSAARVTDGISSSSINTEFSAGRYILISQFSAALGKMRVGLYNPTTDTLTWSSSTLAGATPYRGFLPFHSSNRLRWAYGLGNLPIGIGAMQLYDSILSDDQIRWLCEGVPLTSIESADEWRAAA